jgi:hypothetical protein
VIPSSVPFLFRFWFFLSDVNAFLFSFPSINPYPSTTILPNDHQKLRDIINNGNNRKIIHPLVPTPTNPEYLSRNKRKIKLNLHSEFIFQSHENLRPWLSMVCQNFNKIDFSSKALERPHFPPCRRRYQGYSALNIHFNFLIPQKDWPNFKALKAI